jgi:polar amino acid transport system permease protein
MNYTSDFDIVFRHFDILIEGLFGTLKIASLSLIGAVIIGMIAAFMKLAKVRVIRIPANIYIEIFRNTPGLVQLFWIFYALPVLINLNMNPFSAAVLSFSLLTGAFFAELMRGGIVSIEKGQWEAGKALGMNYYTLMKRIILPQAVKRMIPPFLNRSIELVKTVPLVSMIAYPDILYQAMHLSHKLYRPLEIYTVVAFIYFFMLFPFSLLVRFLEKKLGKADL